MQSQEEPRKILEATETESNGLRGGEGGSTEQKRTAVGSNPTSAKHQLCDLRQITKPL